MSGKIAGVASGLAAIGGGLAFAGLDQQIDRFENLADSIDKVSQRLGINTQFLQENRFAANLAGVEAGTFDLALQRLVRRTGQLTAFGTSEAEVSFKALGIAVRDAAGNLRDSESIIEDSIRAVGRLSSAQQQLAAAQKLVDSEGAAAFVQLVANYDELLDRTRVLGIAFEDDVIERLVQTKDRAAELSAELDQKLSRSMSRLAVISLGVKEGFADAAGAIVDLAEGSDLVTAAYNVLAAPQFIDDVDVLEERLTRTVETMNALNLSIGELSRQQGFPRQGEESFNLAAEKAQLDDLDKKRLALEARIDALRNPPTVAGRGGAAGAGGLGDIGGFAEEEAAATDRAKELARAQRDLAAILDAGRTPAERLSESMGQLERDYQAGLISADELAQGQASLAVQFRKLAEDTKTAGQEFAEEIDGLGKVLLSNFSDTLAEMLLTGQGTFRELAQSFAVDFVSAAIQSAATASFVGLFGGPSASPGLFASAVALPVGAPAVPLAAPALAVAPPTALSPLAASASPPPIVNVFPPPNTETSVSERQRPNGQREIDAVISQTVARDIGTGGPVARALESRLRLRPQGV